MCLQEGLIIFTLNMRILEFEEETLTVQSQSLLVAESWVPAPGFQSISFKLSMNLCRVSRVWVSIEVQEERMVTWDDATQTPQMWERFLEKKPNSRQTKWSCILQGCQLLLYPENTSLWLSTGHRRKIHNILNFESIVPFIVSFEPHNDSGLGGTSQADNVAVLTFHNELLIWTLLI